MKKISQKRNIYDTDGGDKDDYFVSEMPLSVEWHWEGDNVAIDKILDGTTKSVIVDMDAPGFTHRQWEEATSEIDVRNLTDLIRDSDIDNEARDKEDYLAYGPTEVMGPSGEVEYIDRYPTKANLKTALRNADEDMLDRILPSLQMRDSIKKWQQIMGEEMFDEEGAPEGDVTQAEEVSNVSQTQPEEFVEETGEAGELTDTQRAKQEGQYEEPVLPIEEIKQLAPAFADEYGYEAGFDEVPGKYGRTEMKYRGYIPPAASNQRTQAKGLLIRTYEKMPEMSKEKLKSELKSIDTLNDLEIRHVINYYSKLERQLNRTTKQSEE